jgi:hypothetical protein
MGSNATALRSVTHGRLPERFAQAVVLIAVVALALMAVRVPAAGA